MYEIKPVSTLTFIEDRKIKLPRFQRKQTWDPNKNFKLCISIFKNYPIGVTVINEEKGKKNNTRWLLDGRQRRNALIKMSENPEEIYFWARKFLKIKNNMQPDEVAHLFWRTIEVHLETEEGEEELASKGVNENSTSSNTEMVDDYEEEDFDEDYDESDEDEDEDEEISIKQDTHDDLDLLLNIIILCHNKTKSGTKFTKPFDFTAYIDGLDYVDTSSGYKKFDGRKLNTFILGFFNYLNDEDIDSVDFTCKDFQNFVIKRFKVADQNKAKLRSYIAKEWSKIRERILVIQMIKDKLRDTSIGIIELKNATSVDAQNIFKLINSEGTDLTSVEILSAKPSWNRKINNPSSELIKNVNSLYEFMKVQREDKIVRWDFPATLYGRLTNLEFIFKKLSLGNEKDFRRRLTLGFQIMSAIYQNGIKKEKVADISKKKSIVWKEDLEILVNDFNLLGKLLYDHSFFKYVNSWKTSLIELTSDAIGINFFVLIYKQWLSLGKPIGSSKEAKKLQKNSIVLFDKLIYEYVNKQWRGSSDSKIESNIINFNSTRTFNAIPKSKWEELLGEVFGENTLGGDEIDKVQIMKPILYHYYFLKKVAGPNDINIEIEIDHILPQSLFTSSTIKNKNIQHNLYNLALLPKRENISKNNRTLNQITDSWLIDQIVRYSDIKEEEFDLFSKIQYIEELKGKRSKIFNKVFSEDRDNLFIQ